jgi:hypothetical protein
MLLEQLEASFNERAGHGGVASACRMYFQVLASHCNADANVNTEQAYQIVDFVLNRVYQTLDDKQESFTAMETFQLAGFINTCH